MTSSTLSSILDFVFVIFGSIIAIALVIGSIVGVYFLAAKFLFEKNKIFRATLTDVFEKHNEDMPFGLPRLSGEIKENRNNGNISLEGQALNSDTSRTKSGVELRPRQR